MRKPLYMGTMCRLSMLPALIVSASAHAQTQAAPTEEVLVLGSRIEEAIPQELQQYGSRLEVISGEQLRTGGFNDVSQALQMLVPGLYAVPKNGPFDYVEASLLGSRSQDSLYLIDGVRISNRLYGTTSPLDTIPAHMIERIEVLKGGESLFYGTQAVAGVVNIVTKSFSNQTDVGFGAALDSNDGRHADANLRGSAGSTHWVLYGSLDKADGFQPFRDQDYQPSGTDRERSYDVRSAGLKLGQEIGDKLTLTGLYQYTDAVLDFAEPTLIAKNINARIENLASLKVDYRASDRVGLYLKTYYHDWSTHYTTVENDLDGNGQLTGTQSVTSDHLFWGYKDKGVNLMSRLNLHRGVEYVLGGEIQHYSGSDEVYTIVPVTEEVTALFAQARTTSDWLPHTHLALGARSNRTSSGENATVWNLSGRQEFGDALYVRGMAGTSFLLPDAYQLYGAFINEFDFHGNPNLKPEKSDNYELGIGGAVPLAAGQWSWEVTGFRRTIKDLISTIDDGFTDVDNDGNDDYDSVYVNTDGKVNVRGAELQLAMSLKSGWSASFDHTYARARAQNSDLQIARIPESQSKLSLAFQPSTSRLGAGIAAIHVGDVFQVANGERINFGDYTVVDISANAYLDTRRRHRLILTLSNVFDEEYASRLGTADSDDGSTSYAYGHLGAPRTVQLRYTFALRAP